MVEWIYSKKVKSHFFNPKNAQTTDPKPDEFDATATIGSVICGDVMQVWLKINKEKETIERMTWKTFGCASAIASTSVLSEMVKDLPLEAARKISAAGIIKKLGGLPENKIHCSVMGDKALRMAINNYYRSIGKPKKIQHEVGKIIDERLMVTDEEIKDLVRQGYNTIAIVL
jgi:nitrogen fixation NifU-like protein